MLTHGAVEGFFAGVTEWRVAQVVHQGQCLDQIYIQSKLSRDGAGNLRYFDGVGQAIAEVVGIAASEYLGFGFETAEGAGVDDGVAIGLKVVAIGMPGLREKASAGLFHAYGITGEHGESLALLILEFCMVLPILAWDLGLWDVSYPVGAGCHSHAILEGCAVGFILPPPCGSGNTSATWNNRSHID